MLLEATRDQTQPANSVKELASDLPFASKRIKWSAIGMNTQPANRQHAEAGIHKAYRLAGLQPPQKIIWSGSPFSQGLARAVVIDAQLPAVIAATVRRYTLDESGTGIKDQIAEYFRTSMRLFDVISAKQDLANRIKKDVSNEMRERLTSGMEESARVMANEKVWTHVWDTVWLSIWDRIWADIDTDLQKNITTNVEPRFETIVRAGLDGAVGACVKPLVWDKIMDDVWTNIRNRAGSRVRVKAWDALWGQLQPALWERIAVPIGASIKASGNDSAQASGYGQHDAYWLSYYDYFRDENGLATDTEKVEGLIEIANAAGWFAPHAGICWISERPRAIALNKDGLLHAEDGPAIAYPDGWCLYVVNGVLQPTPVIA